MLFIPQHKSIFKFEAKKSVDTKRENNVVPTSMRYDDAASMLLRRCFDVMCFAGLSE